MRPLQLRDLVLHVARLAVSSAALFASPCLLLRALASALLFLAAFAFAHDLAHGSLGLPRRLNEIALALAALPMLVSGHGMRLMHLRHHARPLAVDDLEGAGARVSLFRAFVLGPKNMFELRAAAFRAARGRGARAWQIGETTAWIAITAALARFFPPAALAHIAIALLLQLTIGVWASHIPHHAPLWTRALAARLARRVHSPTLLSLAFHDLHHRAPKIPCAQLGRAA